MCRILFAVFVVEIFWTNAEVSWPYGTYGLPKPKHGCPKYEGGVPWDIGWRKQDMEDDDDGKLTKISSGSHMDANLSSWRKDISRKFCIKSKREGLRKDWPKGSYCIYKRGDCPKEMESGWVRWDDQDKDNNNKKSGLLPDGHYDENTIIYYCCQKQNFWYRAIDLPVDQPFYLLPRKSNSVTPKCQVVKWAVSVLEYIVYDTENNNNGDRFGGSHIFVSGVKSAPKMFYCYYYGCQYQLTEKRGDISLYNKNSNSEYQFCSWLVTVEADDVVVLHFHDKLIFRYCDESFVKIYDGRNSSAPLMATLCGSNAILGTFVISTTNSMFIVLNAGSYSRYPRRYSGFRAQYYTHSKIEQNFQLTKADNGSFNWKSPFTPVFGYPKQHFWLVTVSEPFVVLLNFTSVKIANCNESSLQIYDGKTNMSSLLTTICGSNASSGVLVLSSSNSVFLVLDTKNYLENPREVLSFFAEYVAQPNPESESKLTASNGSLAWSSPASTIVGYPSVFVWLVTVGENFVVVFKVTQFEIYSYDIAFLTIYNGDSDKAPILAVISSRITSTTNNTISSSSNNLYVTLKVGQYLPKSTNVSRFEAVYKAEQREERKNLPPTSRYTKSSKPVAAIVVAVLVAIFVICLIVFFVIFYRKRKQKRHETEDLVRNTGNPSYEIRVTTIPNQSELNVYATPASPQEKLWVGNSTICKESKNPIYQPAEDEDITYNSADNVTYEPAVNTADQEDDTTYEPATDNKSESETALYSNIPNGRDFDHYAEPTTPLNEAHYDTPNMETNLD